mgnify:CR=1 FL=1
MAAKKGSRAAAKKAPSNISRPWYRHPTFYKVVAVCLLVVVAWLIYLDAQVRYKFEGKRWALPAQVYARALEIYDGRALNLKNLQYELSMLQYRKVAAPTRPGEYALGGSSTRRQVSLFIRGHSLPDEAQAPVLVTFYIESDVVNGLSASDGVSQAIYTVDPFKMAGIYPGSREERELLSYEEIPDALIAALLATEDRDFFDHWGVSPWSIVRAMWENMRAGRVVQGGSTLTQQLVKNFYLTSKRSIWRKVNEALMSVMLEIHYSKQALLETYVNDIYLGQSGATAVHGFGMASYFYFGKALQHCDTHELALLVAMVKGPSYYSPRRHPQRALDRRNLVLSLMQQEGYLAHPRYRQMSTLGLGVISKPSIRSNQYPAFLDLVRRQLREEYGEDKLRTEGLKIYTTLDPQLQDSLEQASEKIMPSLAARNGKDLQLGGVVTGVGTGEVLAMLGDKNPRYQGFNRALDASRQIGSLIKPAVFLTALMEPERYHLASTIDDKPFKIQFENGDEWQPKNFDKSDHGEVPLFKALSRSYNVATARLGLDLGVDSVQETLRKLGVEKALNPYPSILLGAQSMSPFEVSKFYQTIASNGFNMPLRAIREVTTAQGDVLSRYPFEIDQVVAAEAIYLLQHALQETMRSGTGRSVYRRLPAALRVAGKTGTTNDNRDSWFSGFSGDYLGVIWVGKDDNSSTSLTGSSGALRVWTELMARIPQYPLATPKPSAIDYHWFESNEWAVTDDQCRDAQPLPVWGEVSKLPYRRCASGLGAWKGWFKGWF